MNIWLAAARPKTLPAAVVPVWVGCVLAFLLKGQFDLWLAVCTLMGSVLIQIATNFFNDAVDSDKGADTAARLGPIRATSSGLLSRKAVYSAGGISLACAVFFGWFLFQASGWPMLVIGLLSFYFSYGYTGGPMPLAYKGLGELFVILFFGFIAVSGTVYVQIGRVPLESILLGLQIGLLSAVLISVNNLRDAEEDRSTGKMTLAARYGLGVGRALIGLEVVLCVVAGAFWGLFERVDLWLASVPVALIGGAVYAAVCKTEPSARYNKYLALSALSLIAFAMAFTLLVLR